MSKPFVSIQRWIYVDSDTLPNAIREFANAMESFEIPEGEYALEDKNIMMEIHYDPLDEEYRAGICMSFKEDSSQT